MSEVLVLCYHAISPTWPAILSVTPEAFERQISMLLDRGWGTATFSEAFRGTPHRRTLAVTFDDAFASVQTYALPVLRRLDVRATVFAPTNYIASGEPLAWPGLAHWQQTAHAGELRGMTWDDLGELAELGWEIGSHSKTHSRLTTLDDEALAAELIGSREECARRVGRPITAIAYPYGDVDDRVEAHVRQAGYAAAAALMPPFGPLDRYRYPRLGVYHKDSMRRFRLKTGRWPRSTYASKILTWRG